jgi:NAD+ diphosphatase
MLGFTAQALTTQIQRRDDELEDAQWFTREDLASGRPLVPPNVSISFRLIEHWFNAGGGKKHQEFHKASSWPASRQ